MTDPKTIIRKWTPWYREPVRLWLPIAFYSLKDLTIFENASLGWQIAWAIPLTLIVGIVIASFF